MDIVDYKAEVCYIIVLRVADENVSQTAPPPPPAGGELSTSLVLSSQSFILPPFRMAVTIWRQL